MKPGINLYTFQKSKIPIVTELWNQNVDYDPITPALLEEKTFGDSDFNPDLTLMAEYNGQIIGFMQGLHRITVKKEHVGWIKLFFTVKNYRRQGIASMLLDIIENQLKSAGVNKIKIIDSNPNYLQPGLDPFYTEAVAFVERRGYCKYNDTSNLIVDLNQNFTTHDDEKILANENIEIRRARHGDKSSVFEFIDSEFPAWHDEISNTFKHDPVTLHLAFYHDQLRAFSGHNGNNFNTGWFGPMGTDPVFRGKGVGGILLKRCLQDMKDQGFKKSIIPWVGPIPFYMHYCNARVHRVFWRYEKIFS